MNEIVQKVNRAVESLTATRNSYEAFIFCLQSIRKSYQITQEEMAGLLNVVQGTICKFESMNKGTKLELLIRYAHVLGYRIDVIAAGEMSNEVQNFQSKQEQMVRELSRIEPDYIDRMCLRHPPQAIKVPKDIAARGKKRIIRKLVEIKHHTNYTYLMMLKTLVELSQEDGTDYSYDIPEELTVKLLAERLEVSERTVRRFEAGDDSMPSASFVFRYAGNVDAELKLSERFHYPEETVGDFYIRQCLDLHYSVRDRAN